MDRQTANAYCRAFGVAEVPTGADPDEWMADNDVFAVPSVGIEETQRAIVREVFGPAIQEAAADASRIRGVVDRIKESHHEVTAVPEAGEWQPLDSGLWDAFSDAPNSVEVGTLRGQVCYRRDYGNARVWFVPAALLRECTAAFVEEQRRYYPDTAAHIRNLARLQTEPRGVLGGQDAVRAIEMALV